MCPLTTRPIVICLLLLSLAAHGDTWTWDGQSANSPAWSDITNWVGDSSIPVSNPGTDLIFGNSIQTVASNDLGWFQLHDLLFIGSATVPLIGDPIEIFGSIVNSSSFAAVFYTPITLGADAHFRAQNGDLVVYGPVANGGHTLQTEGRNPVVLLSPVSGSGGLDVNGPGMTYLLASNAFTGATRVNEGTLNATTADSLRNSGSLLVQGSATALVSGATGIFRAGTSNRLVSVNGPGALLDAQTALMMNGSSNSIVVSAGGRAFVGQLTMSNETGLAGNAVSVNGADSTLTMASDFTMVPESSGGSLSVTGGGRVQSGASIYMAGSNGHISVAGSGSCLTGGLVMVGVAPFSAANTLDVRDGGAVQLGAGSVYLNGSAPTVSVSGAGSVLQASAVVAGTGGATHDSRVEVSGGARLDVGNLVTLGVSNSVILLTGVGTMVEAGSGGTGSLQLMGEGDRVEVRDGAAVALSPQMMGAHQQLIVSDPGTTFRAGASSIGGRNSTMVFSNGASANILQIQGMADSAGLYIGGNGTTWSNPVGTRMQGSSLVFRVTEGAVARSGDIWIEGDHAEITISDPGTRVAASNITALLGGAVGGRLTVSNGAQVTSAGLTLIGTPNGRVDVVGPGTMWTATGDLTLQTMPMRVAEGAHFSAANASVYEPGRLEIVGAGTVWSNSGTFIGGGNTAQLYLTDGARMVQSGNFVSYFSTVVVQGAGTDWTIGGQLQQVSMAQQISFLDGAHVNSSSVLFGVYGTTLVSGPGTVWNAAGPIVLGQSESRLTIDNQGELSVEGLSVGGPGTGGFSNLVQVSGLGTLHASSLEVGGGSGSGNVFKVLIGGAATVFSATVRGGGTLTVDGGTLTAGYLSKTSELYGGSVDFRAGTLNVSSSYYASLPPFAVGEGTNAATLNMTGGSDGRHEFTGGVIVGENSELTGEGTIIGDVEVAGALSPGHSPGTIEVDGTLTLDSSAETLIEIFGPNYENGDHVLADSIQYGGALQVQIGFTPTNGARFQVFSAASHSGVFSSTNVSGVYAALFDAASGEVLVLQAIPEAATLIFFVLGAALFCHRNRSR